MLTHATMGPVEILLVEDNPGDVELIRIALRDCPFPNRLSVAKDGVEALGFLQNVEGPLPRPDLILLDLNLPRKDGREVLACVKQDPALRQIPILVLTSSNSDEDVLQAYDLHANCFISKPASFPELRDMLYTVGQFWFSTVRLPTRLEPLRSI